ncbi:PQ-loop repeat-containing protein 1 isoform X3 [Tetranychus urticae]|uniref:PQ-loop repeat-containing protein 1 isoform X3 n=1 Tax=Tetranychus urticae TaxID=32264 RepID=UPI00077B8969|nr:PQ-loop repeat-containing protein 1 isoform X3 [Tetranychus urticae]
MANVKEIPTPLTKFAGFLASVGIIFGGIIPYIPQYFDIRRTENADGFSLFVCLVLLIANILRIFFWFGKQFETPLLLQSIIMVAVMFAMIEICVRMKTKNLLVPVKTRYFFEPFVRFFINRFSFTATQQTDFDLKYFWDWTDFTSYVEFIASFTVIVGLLMFMLIDNPYFVETIGYAAMLTEALLASPQLIRNHQKKSTEGLSKQMVLLWTLGDSYKTGYFIINQSPIQFLVCGLIQLTIDFIIALQILIYNLPSMRSKTSSHHVK